MDYANMNTIASRVVLLQYTPDTSEEERITHIKLLMNTILDPDPFVAYQASTALHEYSKNGYVKYIVHKLRENYAPIHDETNSCIMELLHMLMKVTRNQIKNGIEIDASYALDLIKVIIAGVPRTASVFDLIDCPNTHHLVIVIDLFKLEQVSRENCAKRHCFRDLLDNLTLSSGDIEKIAKCLNSNNIIVVRKGLELLWRNTVKTTDYSTASIQKNRTTKIAIVVTLSVANAYLNEAFTSYDDVATSLAQKETEFFYSPLLTRVAVDRESLKRAVKVCLAAFIGTIEHANCERDGMENCWSEMEAITRQMCDGIQNYCKDHGKSALVDFFLTICGNEDNDMVSIQHSMLKLSTLAHHSAKDDRPALSSFCRQVLELMDPQDSNSGLKHAELFLHFLFRMGLDHTTLLDMLMTEDAEFLKFFLPFLRYIEEHTDDFTISCSRAAVDLLHYDDDDEEDSSDDDDDNTTQMMEIVCELLDALRIDLQMSEFPYGTHILINRMQRVIDKLTKEISM